jgi:hypothetical protein
MKNALYRVGQGGTGDEFTEPEGAVAHKSLGTTDLHSERAVQ